MSAAEQEKHKVQGCGTASSLLSPFVLRNHPPDRQYHMGTITKAPGKKKTRRGIEQDGNLNSSENYFRAIFNASNDAILVHESETGAVLDCNARFSEMFGYSGENLEQLSLRKLCSNPPYTEEQLLQKILLAFQYGAQIFEWCSKTQSGKVLWVEINLKRAKLDGEDRILAFIQDISDRKLIDRSLRESEKKWRSLAENVPDTITMLDRTGTITFTNREPDGNHGAIGSSIFSQYDEHFHAPIQRAIDHTFEGSTSSFEADLTHTDQTRSHVLRFTPVREAQGITAALLVGTDITEQKTAKSKLLLSQSDLEQKNRSLATIIDIADHVYRCLDTQTVAKEAVEAICDYKFCSSIAFFIVDELSESMELIFSKGMGEFNYKPGHHLPLQGSISGITAINKTITNIRDLSAETRLDQEIKNHLSAAGFQSCYSVPLLFQSHIIGTMTLLFKNKQSITEQENVTLTHIGKTVGLALANARYVNQIQLEIRERQYAEESLRNIAVGISSATGDAFFRGIVANIVKTFDIEYAFIGKLKNDMDVVSIAAYSKSGVLPNFEYQLPGTPCAQVMEGELCAYHSGVQQLFPQDLILQQWGVDSYVGIPLSDSSGALFGIFVLMDTKPLQHVELLGSILRIVANRAGSEIERLKAEQALVFSEEHLRLALKASNVGTWEWQAASDTMKWSGNSAALFGVSSFDSLKSFEEYAAHIHEDDVPDVRRAFEKSLNLGTTFSVQHRLKSSQARHRWLAGQGEVYFHDDGSPSHMRGTVSDITERKQFEVELQESRNMLQLVLDTIPTRVYWKDQSSRYLGCNKIFALDTGLKSAEDIFGKNDYDLVSKNVAKNLQKEDQDVMQSKQPRLNVEHSINNRGKTIWLDTSKIPLTDIDGNIIGVLGTYNDITEHKQAIEAKNQSQQKLQLHVAQTPLAVIEWDTNFRVLDWNPAAEKIFGYNKQEAVGRHANSLILDAATIPAIDAVWQDLLSSRGGERSTNRNITKSGAYITCEWYNTPLVADNGQIIGVTSIAQDITERINNEQELKVYRQHLEELVAKRTDALTHLNKELEAFSYSVSHDLRAPLRSIDGFSQALLEDYSHSFDDTASDYLNRVRAAAQRMSALIDDLLQLSRLTRSNMKNTSVNLSRIGEEICAKLTAEAPQRQAEVNIAPNMLTQGDEGLLRVVLDNLLNNAWKYTSREPITHIEFNQSRLNGDTVYFIRDNGAGFNMQYVDKLFSAFQRLHRSDDFEGNGIGLATVARIVHRHGGKVWAEGEVNKGATFYFTIPGNN
ncbi:MAG: PAS domain S-box protein [Gammaproteobacteria bacterium]|nr:PAS domain S-box protein [Gammaproteobacteria bacterium]MDH5801049.1 PAS domain S-box protein [Gammaproteobacteria bacterium]